MTIQTSDQFATITVHTDFAADDYAAGTRLHKATGIEIFETARPDESAGDLLERLFYGTWTELLVDHLIEVGDLTREQATVVLWTRFEARHDADHDSHWLVDLADDIDDRHETAYWAQVDPSADDVINAVRDAVAWAIEVRRWPAWIDPVPLLTHPQGELRGSRQR